VTDVGSEFCGYHRPQQRYSLSRRVCHWSQRASAPIVSGRPVTGWLTGDHTLWYVTSSGLQEWSVSVQLHLRLRILCFRGIRYHRAYRCSLVGKPLRERRESCAYTIDGCHRQLLTNSKWTRWVL
jgi:hypothetical protein